MKYYPEVVQVITGEGKNIIVYFSDGRITKYNMESLIGNGGVFSKLEDREFFTHRLTVMNNTAAWDLSGKHDPTDCIDIDPVTLYKAEQVSDPLKADLVS